MSSFPIPALFIGHGSPMNALEHTVLTATWKKHVDNIPAPKAIVCISAHWVTVGTRITSNEIPRTIYDFYGFPDELYNMKYPAPGNPTLAAHIIDVLGEGELDDTWGLDHGTWSLLVHLYPEATIPVIQISLDRTKSPEEHYALGKKLAFLREEGVLVIGSGDIVHNLYNMNPEENAEAFSWAEDFNEKVKLLILEKDHKSLIAYTELGNSAKLSVPTSEHYLPLLYILGMQGSSESVEFFADEITYGSISMTSLRIG